jgi:hypothetical protein
MSIFDLRLLIIEEYGKYVQGFFSVADKRVREFIREGVLVKQALWPDDLLQINPPYKMAVKRVSFEVSFNSGALKSEKFGLPTG